MTNDHQNHGRWSKIRSKKQSSKNSHSTIIGNSLPSRPYGSVRI